MFVDAVKRLSPFAEFWGALVGLFQAALSPSNIEYAKSTIQKRLGAISKAGKFDSNPFPVFNIGPIRAPNPIKSAKLESLGSKSVCRSRALIIMTTETTKRLNSTTASAKPPTSMKKLPYQFWVIGQNISMPPVKKSPMSEWERAAT
jgi:hypothetical protein